jgi:integrase/recombinase XerD
MQRVRIERAIDLYIAELARRGRQPSTRRGYQRLLFDFCDLVRERDVSEITSLDCRRFLDRWTDKAASTLASVVSLLSGFFEFLEEEGFVEHNPMRRIKRPRRQRPEDVAVVSVTTRDVERLFGAVESWQELLCLSVACYLGPRRAAIARVRRREADLERGTIRFLEKGGKVAVKPIPDELAAILRAAEENGVWATPGDYLVPNRRPNAVRRAERSDKVIWETVQKVAGRVGVRTHVHALRAAFAVQFDEQHPGQIDTLKELLGHNRLETTLVYLRRKNRAKAMETVKDLSWRSGVFPPDAEEAHTGFEPVPLESAVPDPIRQKLAELTTKTRAGAARGR